MFPIKRVKKKENSIYNARNTDSYAFRSCDNLHKFHLLN